jgi:hypothetical protein
MLTVETLADIDENGTMTVKIPARGARGRRRVVIVIDDTDRRPQKAASRRLPDLADFRARLDGKPYPGNSVVDMRDEER